MMRYQLMINNAELYGISEDNAIIYYDYYPIEEINNLTVGHGYDVTLSEYNPETKEYREIEAFHA